MDLWIMEIMATTSIINRLKKDVPGVGWRTCGLADSEALGGGAKTAESGGSNRQV